MAGQRRGLAGERSGLFYEFSRIIDELAPAWFCIENVPGLLSADPTPARKGGDFGLVLLALTGYPPDIPKGGWSNAGVCSGPKRTVAWRVLDSRFFGVAQRRHRVFLVGGPGASSGFKVLFEPEDGGGDFEADEATGEEVAYALTGGAGSCRFDYPGDTYVTYPVRGQGNWKADGTDNLTVGTIPSSRAGTGYAARDSEDKFLICSTSDPDGVREATGVPGRVDLSVRGEPREVCTCADTPRYSSLGDAMTVNVMEWIGRRIRSVMA